MSKYLSGVFGHMDDVDAYRGNLDASRSAVSSGGVCCNTRHREGVSDWKRGALCIMVVAFNILLMILFNFFGAACVLRRFISGPRLCASSFAGCLLGAILELAQLYLDSHYSLSFDFFYFFLVLPFSSVPSHLSCVLSSWAIFSHTHTRTHIHTYMHAFYSGRMKSLLPAFSAFRFMVHSRKYCIMYVEILYVEVECQS